MAKPIGTLGALLLAIHLACTGPASADAQQASPDQVGLIGRFLVDGQRAAFEWPGSAIDLTFKGNAITVVLRDNGSNSMVVDLDGTVSRIDLKEGRHEYRFEASPGNDTHNLRLTRRTEAFLGTTILEDVQVDGTLLAQPEPSHTILVIGDSISAGYGVEGRDTGCSFSADTENQYLTYAAIAARRFNADVTTLAFSGKGLVHNYDGSTSATMPDIYGRLLPSRDIEAPLPNAEVVIVHLATNDYAGGARPPDFVARYLDLLKALRSQLPGAQIYLGMGPMLAGDDLDAARASIEEVLAARQAQGDTRVASIQFSDAPGIASRGCDWHPNEAGQRYMAGQLERRLSEDLDWKAAE